MKVENRIFSVIIWQGDAPQQIVDVFIPMEWDDEINEWLMTDEGDLIIKETKEKYESKPT
jgi:hypothetical protein